MNSSALFTPIATVRVYIFAGIGQQKGQPYTIVSGESERDTPGHSCHGRGRRALS